MDNTIRIICECGGWCGKSMRIDAYEYRKAEESGLTVIIDGCTTGPEPTDQLVEKRDGYSLYRES